MTNATSNEKRQPWSTPELRRIRAGAAEAKKAAGISDGATTGNVKS